MVGVGGVLVHRVYCSEPKRTHTRGRVARGERFASSIVCLVSSLIEVSMLIDRWRHVQASLSLSNLDSQYIEFLISIIGQ